jgi:hypothetical protein
MASMMRRLVKGKGKLVLTLPVEVVVVAEQPPALGANRHRRQQPAPNRHG